VSEVRSSRTMAPWNGQEMGILHRRGWAARQPAEFVSRLIAMSHPIKLRRGDTLYSEGDAAGGIFGLLTGGLAIEISGSGFSPRFGHIHRAGIWLGHGPILNNGARTMGFLATDDSSLVHVSLHGLRQLMIEDSETARRLGDMANDGMNIATTVIRDLLIPNSARRVAAVLLRVTAVTEGIEPSDGRGFHLTQELISEMANVSRHTCMRIMNQFRDLGWLVNTYGHIRIHRPEAMLAFAQLDD
jgi:CRP/FNR family transcriptional regulator, cyclic AMP receptor protein